MKAPSENLLCPVKAIKVEKASMSDVKNIRTVF